MIYIRHVADEIKANNSKLEYYVPGGVPWDDRGYQNEILAIVQIPRDRTLGTFV